jgi:geranylgeranyl reductase family protein
MNEKTIYDVAVIGGGPAGSAGAFHASKLGLKTILFEKYAYPRSKPCGGALSDRTIPLLGTHAKNAINCALDELRLYAPSYKYFSKKALPGHFVLREEFDEAMAKDAQEAGTQLMDNCRVKSVAQLPSGLYEITADGTTFTAKYILMATGFQKKALVKSPVKRKAFDKDYFAMTVVSETKVDNKILEKHNYSDKILGLFFGAVPNGYGWYFVKDGYINIGIGATALLLEDVGAINAYNRFVTDLKEKNLLPKDLELAKERAFPLPFKKTAEKTVFGNTLLVGDSAGFVSPLTGEGLYYAVRSGQLAAEAIRQNITNGVPLTSYQENWTRDFGVQLNKYAYLMRQMVYKNKRRMELAVALGRADKKMSDILNNVIHGLISYKDAMRKALVRLPMSLFKAVFQQPAS